MMKNILVIAPHADDETLGCGGTLLRHAENGDKLFWLIATIPEDKEKRMLMEQSVKKVSEAYNFDSVIQLELTETRIDLVPHAVIIKKISDAINANKPDIILLPNRTDVHSDHRIIFDLAYSCTKNFRFPFVKKLLMYETLSETEFSPSIDSLAFIPNTFVDVTLFVNRKIEIMEMYSSEIMQPPYPRSAPVIEALARYRGSRIGVAFAEAFVLLYEAV